MGGAIHSPIHGTKHTTMLVVIHPCLLASLFEVFNRFGSLASLKRSSVCWTWHRPASNTLLSFALVLMLSMLCFCLFFYESMLHASIHVF